MALLWATGGVVLPLGMVTTRPLWLETRPRVLLVAREEGGADSVVVGASRHHPVLAAAARLLVGPSRWPEDEEVPVLECLSSLVR